MKCRWMASRMSVPKVPALARTVWLRPPMPTTSGMSSEVTGSAAATMPAPGVTRS